mgnify:CR=1 FL=1
MRRLVLTISLAATAAFAAACQPETPVKPSSNTPNQPAPSSPTPAGSPSTSPSVDPKASPAAPGAKLAALDGEWTGAEGTKLKVTKNGEKYKVEITGLDKKTESFDGTVKGDTIEFTRKGKTETIKAATAEETGVKSLQAEKNCVVINKGTEGYCRK